MRRWRAPFSRRMGAPRGRISSHLVAEEVGVGDEVGGCEATDHVRGKRRVVSEAPGQPRREARS